MSTEQPMKMRSDDLSSSPAFAITGSMALAQLQLPPLSNKGVASDNRVVSEVQSSNLDPISTFSSWAAFYKSVRLSVSWVNMRLSGHHRWESGFQCRCEDFMWPLPALRLSDSMTQEGGDNECDSKEVKWQVAHPGGPRLIRRPMF